MSLCTSRYDLDLKCPLFKISVLDLTHSSASLLGTLKTLKLAVLSSNCIIYVTGNSF